VSSSGLAVRGNASAADRDFKEGLARTVARPGAAAGRISIPDYACRRSHRTAVDAGSIPAASITSTRYAAPRKRAICTSFPHAGLRTDAHEIAAICGPLEFVGSQVGS
jgi:hypothetical protein